MFLKAKNLIKKIYKAAIIIFFKTIYKTPTIKNHNSKSSEEIFKVKINKNNYKIYVIQNGAVFTDTNDTTAYITSENILSPASMQYKKFDSINSKNQKISSNEVLRKGTPKFKKKVKGNVLSLLSGGASKDNFTHWFTDIIPRIKIFESKFKLNNIDKFYVPSIKFKFQRETLELLGIKKDKIISSEKYKHIVARKIFATSHPCFHKPTEVRKWSLIYLKSKFNNKKKVKKYEKIFIDRDQFKYIDVNNLKNFSSYRVLLNEIEIKSYLSSLGFLIIKPENFKFTEQIKIFNNAKFIVGLYGAAMMMLAFCKSNTRVVEIKPQKGGDEFKNISNLNKLNHRQIILKPVIKSPIPQNGILMCPIDKIKKELNILGLKKI